MALDFRYPTEYLLTMGKESREGTENLKALYTRSMEAIGKEWKEWLTIETNHPLAPSSTSCSIWIHQSSQNQIKQICLHSKSKSTKCWSNSTGLAASVEAKG